MSERERWIVYPLLFFALGAAIRDKIIKEVRTGRLHAEQIACEAIAIVDPEDPTSVLAELASTSASSGPGDEVRRVGRLVLTDNEGREYFGLADDFLQMRGIRCESISVVDPENPAVVLAQLTSTQAKLDPAGRYTRRFGVLALNNQSYSQVFGLPMGRSPEQSADPAIQKQPDDVAAPSPEEPEPREPQVEQSETDDGS